MSGPASTKNFSRPKLQNDFQIPSDQEWREAVDRLLKGKPFDKIMLTSTYEEITLNPMYRLSDLEKIKSAESFPGCAPFIRGVNANGYHQNSWHIAQEISYADPAHFNKSVRHDLQRGQDAVYFLVDMATADGLSSNHSDAQKVGAHGTAISNFSDFEIALKDIDLEKYPLYIRTYSSGLALYCMLLNLAKKQGFDLQKISGAIEFDPLGQLLKNGEIPANPDQLYDEMAELTRYAVENTPNIQTIAVSGHLFGDAGGSAIQEAAYAIGMGLEYIRQLHDRGLKIEDISPRIRFLFSIGSNLFMEIAKFRALKMVWYNILKNLTDDELSQKIHIHARSTLFNKTKMDPYVNILRTATEGFSAILGGIESLHMGYFDQLFGDPDEFSRRIARNQQLILKEEANLKRLIDPPGGSWYVENLTDQLSHKIWKEFQILEASGGVASAIIGGEPQKEVFKTFQKRIANLKKRKDIIIGSNMYANTGEKMLVKTNEDKDKFYKKRIHTQQSRGNKILKILSGDYISVVCKEIEKNDLTEIYKALREGQKVLRATPLKMERGAEIFEELRDNMTAYRKKHGQAVSVFLVNMGSVSNFKARADFARGFFEVGGFDVIYPPGFKDVKEAVKGALESQAKIFVLCGNDKDYPEIAPAFVKGVKAGVAQSMVLVAGYPQNSIENLRNAGIDEFIHVRADIYSVLSDLMEKSGVKR